MPPSAEELAQARAAYKENREYDNRREFSIVFTLIGLPPLTLRAFEDWNQGHAFAFCTFVAFVCGWLFTLLRHARRQSYLKSRYAANAALLEKWKDDPTVNPPKRALLWRLDAFLNRKRVA